MPAKNMPAQRVDPLAIARQKALRDARAERLYRLALHAAMDLHQNLPVDVVAQDRIDKLLPDEQRDLIMILLHCLAVDVPRSEHLGWTGLVSAPQPRLLVASAR